MKTKPEVTDEEIQSHMNFDRLLDLHHTTTISRHGYRKWYYLATAVFILSTIATTVFFIAKDADRLPGRDETEPRPTIASDSAIISAPAVVQADSVEEPVGDGEIKSQKEKAPVEEPPAKQPVAVESESQQQQQQQQQPAKPVYVQAAPINGYPDLYAYFNRELKYPQEAMKDSLQGEVVAVFTINREGKPERITIEQSLGPLFDKEVTRLITNMPAWKPATYNNSPVASRMSLPLTFQLKRTNQ